jgi:hypothetical protein
MKRILLIMSQPPGCSGVQGLIYNKILPYLDQGGWEFHFAGPSPRSISVQIEPLQYPAERLHYTDRIAASRRFSVRKNRCRKGSLPYLIFAFFQFLAVLLERALGHDEVASLRQGLKEVVLEADRRFHFDLIAGKSPDFHILEFSGAIASQLERPFVAMVVDPHGYRDANVFSPAEPEKQKALLDQCCGSMYMSPLTLERYVKAGLVDHEKAYSFTDSYPEILSLYAGGRSQLASGLSSVGTVQARRSLHILHLGMLPTWRPIEALLKALQGFNLTEDGLSPLLHVYQHGFLYPAAQQQINGSSLLRSTFHVSKAVSYTHSHWLAEDADAQLVVIGPNHVDNQPSKFFEYLGHHKPMLVIGPPLNPIQSIMDELGIGVYADITDPEAILRGLKALVDGYETYLAAYERQHAEIERYSAHRVAEHWCFCLDSMYRYALEGSRP